jgi:hypothetical protein
MLRHSRQIRPLTHQYLDDNLKLGALCDVLAFTKAFDRKHGKERYSIVEPDATNCRDLGGERLIRRVWVAPSVSVFWSKAHMLTAVAGPSLNNAQMTIPFASPLVA